MSALSISAVAIYYSVAGLVAIFAAAAVPIIIMGTALEVGKLVTAVWLHKNWSRAAWWLKTYLSIAVFILMFITSMGIFGFLSKAHVDQNLSSDTVTQRIEIIDNKVRAENSYIERQKGVLERLTGQSTGSNDRFNQDIAIEQKKIEDAYKRLEVLDADVKAYTDQGKGLFKGDNIKKGLEVRKTQQPERDIINQQIATAQENINKLRAQVNNQLDKNTVEIKTIEKNIFDAQGRIESLIIEQEPLKSQLMKLESEVGPIRYIAEFVYGGQADKNLLEEAVRWVIITIIFVFDPLAVLLLIASQYTFRWRYIDKQDTQTNTPPQPKNPAPTKGDGVNAEWQNKLNVFNQKVHKPEDNRPVDIVVKEEEEDTPEVKAWNQMITGAVAKAKEEQHKSTVTQVIEQVDSKQKLDQFHAEHGNYEDIEEEKEEVVGPPFNISILPDNPNEEPLWDEENNRMDVVAQNGNDGLHYEEIEKEQDVADKKEEISYKQNDEQNDKTIFNKIQAKKPEYTEVIEPETAFDTEEIKTDLTNFNKEIDKMLTQKAKYEEALVKAEQAKRKNEITQEQYRQSARKKEEGKDE